MLKSLFKKKQPPIVGLDIGTTKVACVVGEQNAHGGIDIIGVGNHPSSGLRKGVVINIEDSESVSSLVIAIIAMARSLRCFDAALQGARVSPPLRCLRRQVARDDSLTSSRAQIRAWMRRLGLGWATAPRTSARA